MDYQMGAGKKHVISQDPAVLASARKALGGGATLPEYLQIAADAMSGDPVAQTRWAAIRLADPAAALVPSIVKAYNAGSGSPAPARPARKNKSQKAPSRRDRLQAMLLSPNPSERDYALTQLTGGR